MIHSQALFQQKKDRVATIRGIKVFDNSGLELGQWKPSLFAPLFSKSFTLTKTQATIIIKVLAFTTEEVQKKESFTTISIYKEWKQFTMSIIKRLQHLQGSEIPDYVDTLLQKKVDSDVAVKKTARRTSEVISTVTKSNPDKSLFEAAIQLQNRFNKPATIITSDRHFLNFYENNPVVSIEFLGEKPHKYRGLPL